MINRFIIKLFILFILDNTCFLFAEVKFNKEPIYSGYIKLSDKVSLRTYTIASFGDDTAKTRMYVDKSSRLQFAYFDKSVSMPVYVRASSSKVSKEIIDEKIGRGDKIALSIYEKTFSPYMSYIDTKGLLWYAHNDSGSFESYNIAISSNTVAKDINIVISSFRQPVLFVVDKYNRLYVSRFVERNRDFIVDFIYTNRKVESMYPVSTDKGYRLFIEDLETHNIIFAHRSTNTAFRFLEEYPLVKNVLSYSVYFEDDRRFSLFYTIRDNNNTIYEERFYNEHFENIEYLRAEKKIIALNVSKRIDYDTSIAYLTDDNFLHLHTQGTTYDLSHLGEVTKDFEIIKINENIYAILYYNTMFKELRLSLISVSS